MEERLKTYLRPGEQVRWQGRPAPFSLLEAEAKKQILLKWGLTVALGGGLLAVYLSGTEAPSMGFIGLVLLVFANKKSHVAPYMVVLHCANQDAEKHAMDFLQTKVKKCVVKSKTVRADAVELNAEIRLQDENTGFVNALSQIPGVESAVLVSYNGEYMG